MEILTLHLRDGLSHHPIRDDTHTCITQNKLFISVQQTFFFNLEDVPSNTPRRMAQPTADPNADLGPATLNFGQPHLASIGAYHVKLEKKKNKKQGLTPKRQTTTRQEPRDDGIPRILFLPIPLDRTIKS